jgi:hypothetical protein
MEMKTIIWDETLGLSDANAKAAAELLIDNDCIYTGNVLVVDHARLLRATDQIDSLVINVGGREYHVNQYGAMLDWPPELCHVGDVSEKILRAARKKKKYIAN